jgi:hypothetical protein
LSEPAAGDVMLSRTAAAVLCISLGLLLFGCSAKRTGSIAENLVPDRFGRLEMVETIFDINCFAAAFKSPDLAERASIAAPPAGDVSRKNDVLNISGGKVSYLPWAEIAVPVVADGDLSFEARTRDSAFQCGGGLSTQYQDLLEGKGSDAVEYAFSIDRMTMLAVDADSKVILVLRAQ